VYRRISRVEFEHQLARATEFERMLADDGALILKFWMHLDKKSQRKRLEALEADPLTRWRVTRLHWQHWKMYGRFVAAAEQAIRTTSTGQAPWTIVEGRNEAYRTLTVAGALRDAIEQRLSEQAGRKPAVAAPPSPAKPARAAMTVLSQLDMSQRLDEPTFEREQLRFQGELNRLQRRAIRAGVSTILVFEGVDAAGKGGAIRRITAALDARDYQVIPIAAPTDEERSQHYLWRFWRHLPRAGRVTIFDRSWYGRVLVERVEGFATPPEWRRAYGEINQFEDQLTDHGIVLVKYWIHVSKDEQLRRFKARESSPVKRWKISGEDWRNRAKWNAYEQAVSEMVERTSTHNAPWTLIAGNDKHYARIAVLRTVCERLRKAL
jgi:polyphosphate:AMP phosphotransferase